MNKFNEDNNKIQIVLVVAEANNDALNFVIVFSKKIEFNNFLFMTNYLQ